VWTAFYSVAISPGKPLPNATPWFSCLWFRFGSRETWKAQCIKDWAWQIACHKGKEAYHQISRPRNIPLWSQCSLNLMLSLAGLISFTSI
jgi:hypothetical protein